MNNFGLYFMNGVKGLGKWFNRYSPQILVGCGIAGFGTSMVMIAKEAPRAKEALDDLHRELGESDEELTKNQIIFREIKTVAPIYAPSIATAAVSAGCILGGYKMQSNKTALWAAAYEAAQNNYLEHVKATREAIGEKKEKEIQHAIAQKHIDDNPPPDSGSEIIMTDGKSLFQFGCNQRYLRTTRDEVLKTAKYLSERLFTERWIPFADFLWELGLKPGSCDYNVGFLDRYGIDIRFEACMTPEGGTCQVIIFSPDLIPDPEKR